MEYFHENIFYSPEQREKFDSIFWGKFLFSLEIDDIYKIRCSEELLSFLRSISNQCLLFDINLEIIEDNLGITFKIYSGNKDPKVGSYILSLIIQLQNQYLCSPIECYLPEDLGKYWPGFKIPDNIHGNKTKAGHRLILQSLFASRQHIASTIPFLEFNFDQLTPELVGDTNVCEVLKENIRTNIGTLKLQLASLKRNIQVTSSALYLVQSLPEGIPITINRLPESETNLEMESDFMVRFKLELDKLVKNTSFSELPGAINTCINRLLREAVSTEVATALSAYEFPDRKLQEREKRVHDKEMELAGREQTVRAFESTLCASMDSKLIQNGGSLSYGDRIFYFEELYKVKAQIFSNKFDISGISPDIIEKYGKIIDDGFMQLISKFRNIINDLSSTGEITLKKFNIQDRIYFEGISLTMSVLDSGTKIRFDNERGIPVFTTWLKIIFDGTIPLGMLIFFKLDAYSYLDTNWNACLYLQDVPISNNIDLYLPLKNVILRIVLFLEKFGSNSNKTKKFLEVINEKVEFNGYELVFDFDFLKPNTKEFGLMLLRVFSEKGIYGSLSGDTMIKFNIITLNDLEIFYLTCRDIYNFTNSSIDLFIKAGINCQEEELKRIYSLSDLQDFFDGGRFGKRHIIIDGLQANIDSFSEKKALCNYFECDYSDGLSELKIKKSYFLSYGCESYDIKFTNNGFEFNLLLDDYERTNYGIKDFSIIERIKNRLPNLIFYKISASSNKLFKKMTAKFERDGSILDKIFLSSDIITDLHTVSSSDKLMTLNTNDGIVVYIKREIYGVSFDYDFSNVVIESEAKEKRKVQIYDDINNWISNKLNDRFSK